MSSAQPPHWAAAGLASILGPLRAAGRTPRVPRWLAPFPGDRSRKRRVEIHRAPLSNGRRNAPSGAGASPGLLLSRHRPESSTGRDLPPVPQEFRPDEDPAGGAGWIILRRRPE